MTTLTRRLLEENNFGAHLRNVKSLLESPTKIPDHIRPILKELRAARLGVQAGESNAFILDQDENSYESYDVSVYPSRAWMKAITSNDKRWIEDHWEGIDNDQAEKFWDVMSRHGFKIGSSGGGNFDMHKEVGDLTLSFFYWGNPYHI